MDYNASGAVKKGKNTPRYSEHNAKGSSKNPYGAQNPKAELVARMKAAAEAKKAAKKDD
jgi:dihydroorotate dehydrogenase